MYPGIGDLFRIAQLIHQVAETVKANKRSAQRLASRVDLSIKSLDLTPDETFHNPAILPHLTALSKLFEEIQLFLWRLNGKKAFIKNILRHEAIEHDLHGFNMELMSSHMNLLVALNLDASSSPLADVRAVREEDERDAEEDKKSYETLLEQMMTNQTHLLQTLELQRTEFADAMAAFQKLSDRLPPSIEKTFVQHSYRTLGSLSGNTKIEVHPWTISSLEVEVGDEIATGGFGKVSHAVWLGHTKVAVKQLLAGYETERQEKEFEREVRLWYGLRHPNVLDLYGAVTTVACPLMVCPFMPNGTLLRYASKHPDQRLRLLFETSLGLAYLHSQKIVHGDLKAVNVLIDAAGSARVSDFGFSVMRTVVSSKTNINSSSTSQFGTLRWASPELLQGDKLDFPADVYSFGMVCYEVVVGDLPFGHVSDNGILWNLVVNGKRPRRVEGIEDGLWGLMEDCWRQEPRERPTFRRVAERLERIRGLEQRGVGVDSGYASMGSGMVSDVYATGKTTASPDSSAALITRTSDEERSERRSQHRRDLPPLPTATNDIKPASADFSSPVDSAISGMASVRKTHTDADPPHIPHHTRQHSLPNPPPHQPREHQRQRSVPDSHSTQSRQPSRQQTLSSKARLSDMDENMQKSASVASESDFGKLKRAASISMAKILRTASFSEIANSQPGADGTLKRYASTGASDLLRRGRSGSNLSDAPPDLEKLKRKADAGDTKAQLEYATKLERGNDIDKNEKKAAKYYRLAATQANYPQAQLLYAKMLRDGRGTEKDDTQSAKYFKLAAKQGLASAQCYYATALEEGRGVDKDETKAARYYRMAAEQGDATGQLKLAILMMEGRGCKRDDVGAARFCKSAADQGVAAAQYQFAKMVEGRRGVEWDEKKAVKYYRLAAEQGNGDAERKLARLERKGRGGEEEEEGEKKVETGVKRILQWL
ncbi:Leucine-rich repeat serine/threonine-protein kinase 2 [Rhizophlyctis rosea]|nr:Leucine-rich repeat serine/threonine-protein kinase 2 [Rhizophlyctis rosea]